MKWMGYPSRTFLRDLNSKEKEEEKPSKELIKYFKKWLEREWAYFNLSRVIEKAPGLTITPLSFVKKGERLKIIPERRFKLTFPGNLNSFIIFGGIAFHEASHSPQPLVDQYIFNELIISMIAEFLKNDRDLLGIKKYLKCLDNLKLNYSEIKFLEVLPCVNLIIHYPLEVAKRGYISKEEAVNYWLRYFGDSVIKSEVHCPSFIKYRELIKEDEELAEIFSRLSLFKLMGIDDAEKEARRLRSEGYTFRDLPKIYGRNFLGYSKKIDNSLRNMSEEWKRVVGKRMNLFKEKWKRLSKAENWNQFGKVIDEYLFKMIVDDERYWVDAHNDANFEYVEIMVSYLSDAYIAKKIVEEASKKKPNFENAIRGSCIWRKNEYQFKCCNEDECEHEKRWLDLL